MDKFINLQKGYKYRFVPTGDRDQFFQFVTPTDQTLDIPVSVIQDVANKNKDGLTKNMQIKYLRNKYQIGLPLAIQIYEFALARYGI